MPIDLSRFDHAATVRCGQQLRDLVADAASLEDAASALCRHFYDELTDGQGERASVMVRCYKTHRYGDLPLDLQRFAKRAFGAVSISPPDAAMRCLTLLATTGEEAPWNDRHASRGHQAIPLPSPHIVERAPMIAQLIRELGFVLERVVRPAGAPEPSETAGTPVPTHGVFHVEHAEGSPYIPAQAEFVTPYHVRSVIGMGGALPLGELFAVIVFSRAPVTVSAADRFRALALELQTAFSRFDGPVFAAAPAS